jgi:hypothetical protein
VKGEKREIVFYFVAPPLMLIERRLLTVRKRADGSEYVIAAREREFGGGRVRVTLDGPNEVFVTKG